MSVCRPLRALVALAFCAAGVSLTVAQATPSAPGRSPARPPDPTRPATRPARPPVPPRNAGAPGPKGAAHAAPASPGGAAIGHDQSGANGTVRVGPPAGAASPPKAADAANAPVSSPAPNSKGLPLVELEVVYADESLGTIVIELRADRAPVTVANFLQYVDDGYYEGTIFHRIIDNFIIQGGGYTAPDALKTAGLRQPIRNESRRALKNTRGTISMARKRDRNSALSQFFINLKDNDQLDFPAAGSTGYSVFGQVLSGMDVVERIAAVPTRVSAQAQKRFERYQAEGLAVDVAEKSEPLSSVTIRSIHRLERSEYEQRLAAQPPAPAPTPLPEPSASANESQPAVSDRPGGTE